MMTLFRTGAKTLLIATDDQEAIRGHLAAHFSLLKGRYTEMASIAKDDGCLVVIVDELKGPIRFSDAIDTYLVHSLSDPILMSFINSGIAGKVQHIRQSPRPMILRHQGDAETMLGVIAEDFTGYKASFYDIMDREEGGVVFVLTEYALDQAVDYDTIHPTAFHARVNLVEAINLLKKKDLDYFNAGTEDGEWQEYHIKIYDSYGAYELHYERLTDVLESLELGVIMGEGWGKDAAFVLLSVGVYQVRFFSYLKPKELKRYLMGLEYLEDGTRIVDLDLFLNKKKVSWREARRESGETKMDIAEDYRKMVFSKLTEQATDRLVDLEVAILKTRY